MSDIIDKIKKSPYSSVGLVTVNILFFLWCTFGGDLLYNIGVLSPYHFWEQKEYYRLFSSMFLHGDIYHIGNNMLLLYGLGTIMEKEIGHITYLITYMITGIGGGIASLYYKDFCGDWYVGSIGASGAVFGLVGVLLSIVFFSGKKLPNITPMKMILVVGCSVYNGIGVAQIDNAAHVGGLLTGILIGLLLCIKMRVKRKRSGYTGGYDEG